MLFAKNRLFTKYVGLSWLNCLGGSLYAVALLTYAAQLPNPALGILLITVAGYLPLVFDIVFGALADGVNARVKLVINSGIVQGVIFLVIGWLIMTSSSMWAMLVIGLLNGFSDLFSSFTDLVKMPFLRFLVGDEEREEAIGLNSSVRESIDALGGFLGVLLLGFVGIYFLAYLNAAVFFAVSVGFRILRKPLSALEQKMPQTEVKTAGQLVGQIKKSLKVLMKLTELRNFFLLAAAMNSLFMTAMPVFMMYLADNRQVEIIDYGFTVTLIKLVLLFAGILAGIVGPKYLKNMGTSLCLSLAVASVLGFIVLLGSGMFWLAIGVLSGAAFFAAVFSIRIGAFLYQAVPAEILGTVGGSINFVVAALPLGISAVITAIATASILVYTIIGTVMSIGLLLAIWWMKLDKTDFKTVLASRYQAEVN